jgi:DNA mismatch endonuclease (patch repair protein)
LTGHEIADADMADTLSKQKRSWLMSRVKGSNTLPEKLVESFLRRHAIRFRRHVRELPGTPDIIIPKLNVAILVNGCFWHGHKGCQRSRLPSTKRKFWLEKLRANKKRDERVRRALRRRGWTVMTVWGCSTSSEPDLDRVLGSALRLKKIRSQH